MQPKEINILSIMKDLVSVQSDTGTRQEERAAEKIAEYFESDAYFAAHPDHWGLCDTEDFLGRRVVWALKEGKSRKVLVLTDDGVPEEHVRTVMEQCANATVMTVQHGEGAKSFPTNACSRSLPAATGCPDAQRPT